MLAKLNIWDIIKDHTSTLWDEDRNRHSIPEVLLFYVVPFAAAIGLVYHNISLKESLVNIIIASLSIFVGLLLNLLMLLLGLLEKYRDKLSKMGPIVDEHGISNPVIAEERAELEKKQRLLDHTYYNISFAMLSALICIPIMVIALIDEPLIKCLSNLVGYFLLLIFTITLFMVLTRVHTLLKEDTHRESKS